MTSASDKGRQRSNRDRRASIIICHQRDGEEKEMQKPKPHDDGMNIWLPYLTSECVNISGIIGGDGVQVNAAAALSLQVVAAFP